MTETIESLHRKIYTKLKILLKLEKNLEIDLNVGKMIDEYLYNMTPFLNQETNEICKVNDFMDIYNTLSIEERIAEISSKYCNYKCPNSNENKKLIKEIEHIIIVFNDKEERELCKDCGGIMHIDCNIFRLVCSNCNLCIKIFGSNYDYQTTPIQKLKNNNCIYNKHSINWVMQIQAKKSVYLDDSVWKKLNDLIVRDKTRIIKSFKGKTIKVLRNFGNIKCVEFRPWLKELGLTKLNPDIPYLRKVICHVIPYQLLYLEEQQILYLHSQAVETYKKLCREEFSKDNKKIKNNTPYLPYMIGKIIEHMFPANIKENIVKRSLLECIHVQSEETTIDKDVKWEKICNIIGIDYIPTSISNYTKLN